MTRRHPLDHAIRDNIERHAEAYTDAGVALLSVLDAHPANRIDDTTWECQGCCDPSGLYNPYPCDTLERIGRALRVYPLFTDAELAEINTTRDFAMFLRTVGTRSGMTAALIARRTGIHRSQIYLLTNPDRCGLPRNPEQLYTFMSACGMQPEQIEKVIDRWTMLRMVRDEAWSPETVATVLLQVDVYVPTRNVAEWSWKQRRAAGLWAAAVELDRAGVSVNIPERPEHLPEPTTKGKATL